MAKNRNMSNTVDIEAKAINEFKRYMEDSHVILPIINDNDKEPSWDGFLYIYNDGIKDKSHYNCRIPVQIKGHEVDVFKDGYKEKIEVADLRAYLSDPVVYVVCLIKKDSKERKLLYRNLLPETIKNILKGKDKIKTASVLMKPMPAECSEFEKILQVFNMDKIKQLPYAYKPSLSIKDFTSQKIHQLQLAAPRGIKDPIKLMKYLSKTPTYLYAQLNTKYDVSIPIEGGEALLKFNQTRKIDVGSGGRVFYKEIRSEIEDGKMSISIGNALKIELPEENGARVLMHFSCTEDELVARINETEFILTLYETNTLEIGGHSIAFSLPESPEIGILREHLPEWKALQALLDKMHVTKPLLLSKIAPGQGNLINMLIDGIIHQKKIVIPNAETKLYVIEIANIHLLCWVLKDEKSDQCAIGDYFDGQLQLSYRKDGEICLQSAFSYLREAHLWEEIDNIPFEQQVEEAKKLVATDIEIYDMTNQDVLFMIKAADAVAAKDAERAEQLLENARIVCLWLLKNDNREGAYSVMYELNNMQIVRRQRELNVAEKKKLRAIIDDESITDYAKIGVAALLGDKAKFEELKQKVPKEEYDYLCSTPISKFFVQ